MLISFASFALAAIPGIAAVLVVCRRRYRFPWVRVAFLAALGAYLMMVVNYTLFPVLVDPQMAAAFAETPFWARVNLVPTNLLDPKYLMSVQGAGNVLLAAPFGFLLPLVARTTWRQAAARSLLFTVAIELSQLAVLALLGSPFRTVDVADVALNWVGAMGGYVAFFGSGRLYELVLSDSGTPSGQLWGYIAWAFRRSSVLRQQ